MVEGAPNAEEVVLIYNIYRDYIKSEDSLINSRMTWMLAIHGFLYATYGFTSQKLLEINERAAFSLASKKCDAVFVNAYTNSLALHASVTQIFSFLFCLCGVGAVISFTALASVSAAYDAATSVRLLFENNNASTEVADKYVYKVPGRIMFLPLLTGGGYKKGTESKGFMAAWSIPCILIASWAISSLFLYNDYKATQKLFDPVDKCASESLIEKTGPNSQSSAGVR